MILNLPKKGGKSRKKHKNTLHNYSRTESFNRIAGFTATSTRVHVVRNRIILTVFAVAIFLVGFYFVLL